MITQGVLRMLRLYSGSAHPRLRHAQALLRLCSGLLTLSSGKSGRCSRPETKTEQPREKFTWSLWVLIVEGGNSKPLENTSWEMFSGCWGPIHFCPAALKAFDEWLGQEIRLLLARSFRCPTQSIVEGSLHLRIVIVISVLSRVLYPLLPLLRIFLKTPEGSSK